MYSIAFIFSTSIINNLENGLYSNFTGNPAISAILESLFTNLPFILVKLFKKVVICENASISFIPKFSIKLSNIARSFPVSSYTLRIILFISFIS